MISTGVSCSDVYVDECLITCGYSSKYKPTLEVCQIECIFDELCASWRYDKKSQVKYYQTLAL